MQNPPRATVTLSATQAKHDLLVLAAMRRRRLGYGGPNEETFAPTNFLDDDAADVTRRPTAPVWSAIHD
jgi:hypothetical protein